MRALLVGLHVEADGFMRALLAGLHIEAFSDRSSIIVSPLYI